MMTAITTTATMTTAPSLAEIDVELFTFVERYATNLVRWDLLLFFGSHPDSKATAAELSQQLKRSLKATTKELEDMTYLRLLTRRYTPEKVTYQLVRRRATRKAVTRLAAYASKSYGSE